MMHHFCTYFDRHYLPRALALYDSLTARCPDFHLWALCFDDESHRALAGRPNVTPISLTEFEDAELLQAKATRTLQEYYFTCTPSLPLYLFRTSPEIDRITYIDSDLFFFDDPQLVFDEIGDSSIAIIPHRFARQVRDKERSGKYNVGWLTFRRDENAMSCLSWWRERCLEWCYARHEDGKYADQKYLDDWPQRFDGVLEIKNPGANLGPWNLANYRVEYHDGHVSVDGRPLVFYHFSSFIQIRSWLFHTNFRNWRVRPNRIVRRHIIEPYLKALAPYSGSRAATTAAPPEPTTNRPISTMQRLAVKAAFIARVAGGIMTGNHVLVVCRRVL